MQNKRYFLLGIITTLIAAVLLVTFGAGIGAADSDGYTTYEVKADSPRLNRKLLGDPTGFVQGVPAEPVHSFVWDGDGSVQIEGEASLEVDPVNNTGEIKAEWTDMYGEWTFKQEAFFAPDHANGLRVSSDGNLTELEFGDGIPLDVYLHGNTTAGGPVLPTVFNLIATWGPAEVTLNGEAFDNPYDGPTPLWVAHTMTTVGVRDENGQVLTKDGDIWNPMDHLANGAVDYDDLEFHLVFHDAPGPLTDNFPPPLDFFYHLTFENVQVEINHSD